MAKKSSQTLRQIVVVFFLILVVVGFTVPIILYSIDDPFAKAPAVTAPRLCRSDADCFLTCENQPLQVLCLQNYCIQNTCEEYNPYSYTTPPLDFTLSASINNEPVAWAMTPDDSFITVTGNSVSVFTTDLAVRDIAGKLGLYFTKGCLYYNNVDYCPSESSTISILVNGNSTVGSEGYVPVFGDKVEIVYE